MILSLWRSANLEIVDIESNPILDEKEEDLNNVAIANDESKLETAANLETVQATNEIKDASKIEGDLVVTDVEAGLSIRDEPDGEGVSLISDEPKIMSRSSLVSWVIVYRNVTWHYLLLFLDWRSWIWSEENGCWKGWVSLDGAFCWTSIRFGQNHYRRWISSCCYEFLDHLNCRGTILDTWLHNVHVAVVDCNIIISFDDQKVFRLPSSVFKS